MLEVLGRVDDVVQVGGVNVAVSAVEDALRTVCADACVLAVPDEAWGSRLTAYVVAARRPTTRARRAVDERAGPRGRAARVGAPRRDPPPAHRQARPRPRCRLDRLSPAVRGGARACRISARGQPRAVDRGRSSPHAPGRARSGARRAPSIAYYYLAPLIWRLRSRDVSTATAAGSASTRPAHRRSDPGREGLHHTSATTRRSTLVGSSRCARCSRSSSRSRCRSASTTPTTTATASAAPTTCASGRCASSASGSRRRAAVKLAAFALLRRRRDRRARARAAHPGVVAARSSALAAILAAWFYTGGRAPTATPGSASCSCSCSSASSPSRARRTCRSSRVTWLALAGGVAIGALSVAILLVNNLRDIPTDELAGKHTLAVRLGDARHARGVPRRDRHAVPRRGRHRDRRRRRRRWSRCSRCPLAIRPARLVRGGAAGRDLIPALAGTGLLLLGYAVRSASASALAESRRLTTEAELGPGTDRRRARSSARRRGRRRHVVAGRASSRSGGPRIAREQRRRRGRPRRARRSILALVRTPR